MAALMNHAALQQGKLGFGASAQGNAQTNPALRQAQSFGDANGNMIAPYFQQQMLNNAGAANTTFAQQQQQRRQINLKELHEKFLPIEASGTFWTGLP